MLRELQASEMGHISGGDIVVTGTAFLPEWQLQSMLGSMSLGETNISLDNFIRNYDFSLYSDPNRPWLLDSTVNEIVVIGDPSSKVSDWCGSTGSGWVPDSLHGVYVGEACRQHDWAYSSASYIDRLEADRLFFNDLFGTLLAGGVGIVQAAALAFSYFAAVRIAGSDAYHGNGQNN